MNLNFHVWILFGFYNDDTYIECNVILDEMRTSINYYIWLEIYCINKSYKSSAISLESISKVIHTL